MDTLDYGTPLAALSRWRPAVLWIFIIFAVVFSVIPIVNHVRKVKKFEAKLITKRDHPTSRRVAVNASSDGELPDDTNPGTKDYRLWFRTGDLELHGRSPYYKDRNGEFPFMYPPGAAGLLALLSAAGPLPMMVFLVLLNSAAWATCIFAPIFLLTGRARGAPLVLYWVPSALCVFYIWDTYLEGQMAFVLCAALLGMLVCLRTRRPLAAGLLLALAAGFKAFPILALPYLIYRRQWRAIAYTAGFLVLFLVVIPTCFRGPAGAVDDLVVWRAGMMTPNTPEKIGQRAARSYTWQNGSILSVAHRWLRPVDADTDDNLPKLRVNVAALPFKLINWIANTLSVALCLAYLGVLYFGRSTSRIGDTAAAAMLLILIICFAPLSFTYNTAWLMCGITVVIWFALTAPEPRQRRFALIWLGAAVVPLVFSMPNVPAFRVPRALGNTLLSDLLLLGELAWITFANRDPTPADEPSVTDDQPGSRSTSSGAFAG